ncbi:MAG: hypothetical protein ABEJ22_08905 [Haloferacaceae archaeon]
MPDPAKLRDSTQVVVPTTTAESLRDELEARFTVTFVVSGDCCRIVGSPVEIKAVSNFLARQGVSLP